MFLDDVQYVALNFDIYEHYIFSLILVVMQQGLCVTVLHYLLDNAESRHLKVFNFYSSKPDPSFQKQFEISILICVICDS